jgi:hypothetical protein
VQTIQQRFQSLVAGFESDSLFLMREKIGIFLAFVCQIHGMKLRETGMGSH